MEKHVYDMIARRFIAVFYPDCKFATTTVMGEVDKIEFKATGKQILEPGWRVLFEKQQTNLPDEEANKEKDEERVLPAFVKGESGEHIPDLAEKMTTPPKFYTEATLLRAMETAGKLVDSDELRDALKENGIGRPSTRAAIIETLFKRKYIRKEKKNLVATPTGMELIGLIREELLKSAELTGIWEKKLREIEKKSYDAATFVGELKQMVTDIVNQVLADNTNRRISLEVEEEKPAPKKRAPRKSSKKKDGDEGDEAAVAPGGSDSPKPKPASQSLVPSDELIDTVCPVCGQGRIIKGRAAYGCSNWKSGCKFVLPFNTEVK
jgi:DNA topoisomerase-3